MKNMVKKMLVKSDFNYEMKKKVINNLSTIL